MSPANHVQHARKNLPFTAMYPLVAIEIAFASKDFATFVTLAALCGEHREMDEKG